MRGGIIALLFLIVLGVMLANIIANPQGTKVVFDGLTKFWGQSINGLLARTPNSGGAAGQTG
jgi:hypothetical protein